MPSTMPVYCPTENQKGSVITAKIKMYDQCTTDYDLASAIRYSIDVEDYVGGSGLTFSDTTEMTPINTAASVKAIQNLFAGRDIKWTANIQNKAFSKQLDELCYGTTFEPDPDRPGWSVMPLADRVGERLPRYAVIIQYFEGVRLFAEDFVPAAEIMVTGGANMAAGVVYNRQMEIMAQTAAVAGYPSDTRAIRYFKDAV